MYLRMSKNSSSVTSPSCSGSSSLRRASTKVKLIFILTFFRLPATHGSGAGVKITSHDFALDFKQIVDFLVDVFILELPYVCNIFAIISEQLALTTFRFVFLGRRNLIWWLLVPVCQRVIWIFVLFCHIQGNFLLTFLLLSLFISFCVIIPHFAFPLGLFSVVEIYLLVVVLVLIIYLFWHN